MNPNWTETVLVWFTKEDTPVHDDWKLNDADYGPPVKELKSGKDELTVSFNRANPSSDQR